MAEKTCSKCKKGLRADNTSGVCGDRNACAHRVADAGRVSSKATSSAPAKVAVVEGKRVCKPCGLPEGTCKCEPKKPRTKGAKKPAA